MFESTFCENPDCEREILWDEPVVEYIGLNLCEECAKKCEENDRINAEESWSESWG